MVEDVEEPRDSKGSKDMALAEVVLFITDSVMEKTGTTWHDIVQAGSWAMLVPHFWIKKKHPTAWGTNFGTENVWQNHDFKPRCKRSILVLYLDLNISV